jgi:hypothetical protein
LVVHLVLRTVLEVALHHPLRLVLRVVVVVLRRVEVECTPTA